MKVRGMGVELENSSLYSSNFTIDQVVIANDKEDME